MLLDTKAGVRSSRPFNVNPLPGSTVGSYPNAITMPDAHHILVSIGRDNALAVYELRGPRTPVQYEGLMPTDLYPVDAQYDPAIGKIVVTNDKGIGARGIPSAPSTRAPDASDVTGHNTYDDTGSITGSRMPSQAGARRATHQVFVDNDWRSTSLASKPLPPAARPPRWPSRPARLPVARSSTCS